MLDHALECLLEYLLNIGPHLLVAMDVMTHSVLAGLLDEPGGLRKSDNAPHRTLTDAAFEQVLIERLRLRSDVAAACQQEGG